MGAGGDRIMAHVMVLPKLGEKETVSFLFSSLTSNKKRFFCLKLQMLGNFIKLEPNCGTLSYTGRILFKGFVSLLEWYYGKIINV